MKRAALHAACVGFALLLRFLSPQQAILLAATACVFNLIFLPKLAPSLYRSGETNAASGIFMYPIAILLLVATLPLHVAATCWAILALGDAAASIAGRGPAWIWNPRKTMIGTVAFVIVGFAGGAALWWWTAFTMPPWPKLAIAVAIAALVESLPLPVDDNLTVPIAPAVLLGTFVPAVIISPIGVGVSLVLAIVSFALHLVTISGAIAGFAIAALLYSFGGWPAFALLAAFFVIGSGATRVAYHRKQAMGLAEGLAEKRKGARVAEQAVANAGAAVFFAFIGQPIAVAASLAAAAADTVATETGPLTKSRVYLLVTGHVVKPGTSGGVSVAGTLAGILTAAAVAGIAVAIGVIGRNQFFTVTIAAATGSLADSMLGGTLEKDGWLNNEGVNFLGTTIAGMIALGLLR